MSAAAHRLRPFTPDDYAAAVSLGTLVFGEDGPMDVETLRRADASRDPTQPWERILAVSDGGDLTGMAQWGRQRGGAGAAGVVSFWIVVHPEARRQGVGSALFAAVLEGAAPLAPLALYTSAREDKPDAVSFLERRGFTEAMRSYASHLPLADFRPEEFAGVEKAVAAQGIVIRTFAESGIDPEARRRVYEIEQALWRDVPSPEPYVPVPFEEWQRRLENPLFLPEAFFVAVDGVTGEFVGVSTLSAMPACKDLLTGLTGVRRDYRRRGIALALKVRAARYALAAGAPSIRTGNASHNAAMLAVNERLGFQRQSARIRYVRHLGVPGSGVS